MVDVSLANHDVVNMNAQTVEIGSLVSRTQGVKGGRPCIAGTGVTIKRIAGWHRLGMSPEDIAAQYGHLSLAQVHAALAYYHANREEIDTDLRDEAAEYNRLSRGSASEAAGLSVIRLYLDEDAAQHGLLAALRLRGVDVTSAQEVGLIGAPDQSQLE